MRVWVVEEFFNEYDQQGGVLLGIFNREPMVEDLRKYNYTSFGRENLQYSWVEKRECPVDLVEEIIEEHREVLTNLAKR